MPGFRAMVCYAFVLWISVCLAASPWPGLPTVTIIDPENMLSKDVSGLDFQPIIDTRGNKKPVLLGITNNSPPRLFRMEWNDAGLLGLSPGWENGKMIFWPDGTGAPDTEDLTLTLWEEDVVYACTERDNNNRDFVRQSILRYEMDTSAHTLSATHEWSLDQLLPPPPASSTNRGPEAITWIPDSFLVKHGFYDQERRGPYVPSAYPNHGTGVFFVGLEEDGDIYAFVVDYTNTSSVTKLQKIQGAQDRIMYARFDRTNGYLWGGCDNNCNGESAVYAMDRDGVFRVVEVFAPPADMDTRLNNEGFAIEQWDDNTKVGEVPHLTGNRAYDGYKRVWWGDDDFSGGHAIREGFMLQGDFLRLNLIEGLEW